jgi:hypothetical protein
MRRTAMHFLVCQCGAVVMSYHTPLPDVVDEDEAVSKAKAMALTQKEGMVVLFKRDGTAICGWEVSKDGPTEMVREIIDVIGEKCNVTPESFDAAKNEAGKRRHEQR